MKLFISLLLAMFAATTFAAEPAYWMKSYPGADQAKVQRCLAVADEARNKALTGGAWGSDIPVATLKQGLAWEACMDAKE